MASKDDIIAELREIVATQAKQIAAQAKQIEDLKNRIDDLELKLAKAQKNSSNSSKSPSSDITSGCGLQLPPVANKAEVSFNSCTNRSVPASQAASRHGFCRSEL
jgi:uncharacterized coiled-coil protein SlyX